MKKKRGVVAQKVVCVCVCAIINKKMCCIYSKLNSSSFDLFPLFNAL